jgi:hypothetical protein
MHTATAKENNMSYSFGVQAPTKKEAEEKVSHELVKVIESQSMHKKDADQAANAAFSMIALLREDETKDIYVSVSGSIGWEADESLNSASVNVHAYLSSKTA